MARIQQPSQIRGFLPASYASRKGTFTLNSEEEAALLEAIAEADRGELLPADEVLKQLPVRSRVI